MTKRPKYAEPSLFPEEDIQDGLELLDNAAYDFTDLFERLAKSGFRSRFRLTDKDKSYIAEKGLATMRRHAADFVAQRLAPAVIPNDGKQTPMRGHPVFLAQHATGCCCRGCLLKWHHIPPGRLMTEAEQRYAVAVLMAWIDRQLAQHHDISPS